MARMLTSPMNLFNESIEVPLIVFELLFMARANGNAMLYDAPFTAQANLVCAIGRWWFESRVTLFFSSTFHSDFPS